MLFPFEADRYLGKEQPERKPNRRICQKRGEATGSNLDLEKSMSAKNTCRELQRRRKRSRNPSGDHNRGAVL